MNELLLRLFIKDYKNSNSPSVHLAIGRLSGVVGIVCNFLLFLGKIIAGLLAGSVSIVADAVNNLSDAASSVVTLIGFKLAQRPADEEHPYGHARYEYIAGLIVSFFVLLIGVSLTKSSVSKIIAPVKTELSVITFTILAISILVKLWLSSFYKALGKRTGSTTLKASSIDSRNDVVSTLAVLLGCLVEYLFDFNIDGYVGLAVAIFILYSGVDIAKETLSPLLGRKPEKGLVDKIGEEIKAKDGILGYHDLLIHDYGPGQCFASVHVEMDSRKDIIACHEAIDEIERKVMEDMNVHLVIHYDPVVTSDQELKDTQAMLKEILHSINPDLALHDLRIVRGGKSSKLFFDVEVPFLMKEREEDLKEMLDKELAKRGKNYQSVINFDRK